MKRFFSLTCLSLLLSLSAMAQKQTKIEVTLDPSLDTKNPVKIIKLYKAVEGTAQVVAKADTVINGLLTFTLDTPKGYYQLTYVKNSRSEIPVYLYLQPGVTAQLTITKDGWVITDNNTKENKKMGEFYTILNPIILKTIPFSGVPSNYEDFFPDIVAVQPKIETFLKGAKTGNSEFDAQLPKVTKYATNYFACWYPQTPRSKHPKVEDFPKLYSDIIATPQNDEFVLSLPFGVRYMNLWAGVKAKLEDVKFNGNTQTWILDQLGTKRLKGAMVAGDYTRSMTTVEQYEKLMAQFGSNLNDTQRKMVKDVADKLPHDTKVGVDGFNFSYPDATGKTVSFSDLKGKLVFVDIWATWCAPCRKEIPFLIELEKEMHDKDIYFVAIGTDGDKDQAKWKTFIEEKGMEGIQLFGGNRSKEIMNAYGINGIPRFMLFDRNGKVISASAPHPSDPALKELILKNL